MNFTIGLSSWIIQDGNYPEFCTGEKVDFALEYRVTGEIGNTNKRNSELNHIGRARYDVVGRRLRERDEDKPFLIIDIGVKAYSEMNDNPLANVMPEEWFSSQIYLGVDPYDYKEGGKGDALITPLIYSWKVEGISMQVAPFVRVKDANGTERFVRDANLLGYREIKCTNAKSDDNGMAEYLLHCTLLDVRPKVPDEVVS